MLTAIVVTVLFILIHQGGNMMRSTNQELNQLTKESLKTALVQLLAENQIADISVTQLTKRAGVSRMAYYRNYPSVTALYHDVYAEYFHHFFEANYDALYQKKYHLFWENLFNYLFEHQAVAKILLSPKEHVHFLTYLNTTLCEPLTSIHEQYLFRGAIGSVFNILTQWVQNDFDLAPKQIAQLCTTLTASVDLNATSLTVVNNYLS